MTMTEILFPTIIIPLIIALIIFVTVILFTGRKKKPQGLIASGAKMTVEVDLERSHQEGIKEYYDIIVKYLNNLPEIKVQHNISVLIEKLNILQEELRGKAEPFLNWSKLFREIAGRLEDFLPVDEKVKPIADIPTLKVRRHFNIDLNRYCHDILAHAKFKEESECGEEIKEFKESVGKYEELFRNWRKLRDVASYGISEDLSILKRDWGWLSHGIYNELFDSKSDKRYIWLPWDVVSSSQLLDDLSKWIIEEITQLGWRFDTICAMEGTSLSLATLMSSHWGKRLLVIDNKEFDFLPAKPTPQERILLVDSGIQTGEHLQRSVDAIEKERAIVEGAICIFLNDMLPPEKNYYPL